MEKNLYSMKGKVCLITGGSTGLGSYIAHGFLAAGASRVYITARSKDNLVKKKNELEKISDGECIAIKSDLSSLDGVNKLVSEIRAREQHIDVLVNNAGIGLGTPIKTMRVEDWDRTMELNTKSPIFLTQALLDMLSKNATLEDPSRVIFISSVAASIVVPSVLAYSASKKMLEHLTTQLALAVSDDFIRVNAIAPGLVKTPLTQKIVNNQSSLEYSKNLHGLNRIGSPDNFIPIIESLIDTRSDWITGQTFSIDGGLSNVK